MDLRIGHRSPGFLGHSLGNTCAEGTIRALDYDAKDGHLNETKNTAVTGVIRPGRI
jgi:hypothetical protein